MTRPTLDNDTRLRRLFDLHKQYPTDPDIPYMIGVLNFEMGRTDDALEGLARCLELDPGYVYAYYHKARVLRATGDRSAMFMTLGQGYATASKTKQLRAADELRRFMESEAEQ